MNENNTDKKLVEDTNTDSVKEQTNDCTAKENTVETAPETTEAEPSSSPCPTPIEAVPDNTTEAAETLPDAEEPVTEQVQTEIPLPASPEEAAIEPAPTAAPARRHSKTAILCGSLCFIFLCICAVICCAMFAEKLSDHAGSGSTVIYKNDSWTNPGQIDTNNALVNAVAKASPSVVAITTESVSYTTFGDYVSEGAGSGVICTEDGYIITNHHVISGATNIQVTLENGDIHKATLVGTDSQTDLAVIKIDATGLIPTTFATPDSVMVGQTVIAIGNPLGTLSNTVTNGIVSALARQLTVGEANMTLLQHNAAVSPGNSGGGLFNVNGELIGIVNAKSSGEGVEGIGFAIPLQTINTVVPELIENGYVTGRPQLGITAYEILSYQTIYSVPTEIRRAYEAIQRPGIYINTDDSVQYSEGSEKLQIGDYLSAIDDQLIDEFVDISLYLSEKKAGETVKLTVYRYDSNTGKTAQVNVTIVLSEKK